MRIWNMRVVWSMTHVTWDKIVNQWINPRSWNRRRVACSNLERKRFTIFRVNRRMQHLIEMEGTENPSGIQPRGSNACKPKPAWSNGGSPNPIRKSSLLNQGGIGWNRGCLIQSSFRTLSTHKIFKLLNPRFYSQKHFQNCYFSSNIFF